MDVERIASALEPLVLPAAPYIHAFAAGHRPHNLDGFNQLHDQLVLELEAIPNLWKPETYTLLSGAASMGLMASNLAAALLKVAVTRGPRPAALWFQKLLSGVVAESHFVAHVSGVEVHGEVRLSPEVSLLPFDRLPSSAAKETVKRSTLPNLGTLRFPIPPHLGTAAVYKLPARPFLFPVAELDAAMKSVMDATRDFERQIATLTAVEGCAPLIETYWHEFDDADFEEGRHGTGFMQPGREGRSSMHSVLIGPDAAELLRQRRDLSEDHRRVLDLALARLNQASRRLWPGDKAIDASICLEALLCKAAEETGMTRALKERAASLLSSDRKTRSNIRKTVGALYSVRGKVVHGRAGRDDMKSSDAAEVAAGLVTAREVVRAILAVGHIPDWPDLPLTFPSRQIWRWLKRQFRA